MGAVTFFVWGKVLPGVNPAEPGEGWVSVRVLRILPIRVAQWMLLFFFLGVGCPSAEENLPWERFHLALGAEARPEGDRAESESTVVKIPLSFSLRKPSEDQVGFKLRIPVYFSWNSVSLNDPGGNELSATLQTLVVTPGIEVQIPVGNRWMLRPFAEFGGISALNIDEGAWLASVGIAADSGWEFSRWHFRGGGRFKYSVSWTGNWKAHDDLAFLDFGGALSRPIGKGGEEGIRAGFFAFPRVYMENLLVEGPEDSVVTTEAHLELGFSIEFPKKPEVLGIRLPAFYGLGYRFAHRHSAFRIYLGFPF